MLRVEKKNFVEELESIYRKSNSVIIVHYHGLTVANITALRSSLREDGASFKIVKNTLAKIAASNSGMDFDSKMFAGPTAIAYSEDAIAAAKGVVKFAKTNDNLKIVGGIVNERILNMNSVQQLAKLPSLDQLRGNLIGILQAPAGKIARILQTPAGNIARVCKAYAEK